MTNELIEKCAKALHYAREDAGYKGNIVTFEQMTDKGREYCRILTRTVIDTVAGDV